MSTADDLLRDVFAGEYLVEGPMEVGPPSKVCKWCGWTGIEPHPSSVAAMKKLPGYGHAPHCLKVRYDAYLNALSSPAPDSTLADSMRSAGDYADEWQTRCGTCNRTIKGFCIYVEDRDGRGFDGGASVLASFLFCSPRCLKAYAESYDNDKPALAALEARQPAPDTQGIEGLRAALEKIAGGYGVPDSMLMLPKPEFQAAFVAHLQGIARAALNAAPAPAAED